MKRLIFTSMLLFLSLNIVVAARPFSFGIGFIGESKDFSENIEVSDFNISDYKMGAEARLKVAFVEGSVSALLDEDNSAIETLFTFGLNLNIFKVFDLALGVGPKFSYNFTEDRDPYWSRSDNQNSYGEVGSFGEAFKEGIFHYRAHTDFVLGPLSAGLYWSVPTQGFSFCSNNFSQFLPEWDQLKMGISLMLYLI